ncbi:MAG: hypothetical protein A2157_19895 [Deltaproteobacteria bacterium RBG_16_47_11]|nr:MAG: hypothetical protein A2157_19895 [Deltaproteobacteria bacterium RBG_16_47_11]
MVQGYLLALQVHGIRDGPCSAPSLKRGVPSALGGGRGGDDSIQYFHASSCPMGHEGLESNDLE